MTQNTELQKALTEINEMEEERNFLRDKHVFFPLTYNMNHSDSGINVTREMAVTLDACFACINVLAQTVGVLSWGVFRRDDNGISEPQWNRPVYRLLHDEPNPHMSSQEFREAMMVWMLTSKAAYAEIVRDTVGRPVAMYPLISSWMKCEYDGNTPVYKYQVPGKPEVTFQERDIFKVHGIGETGIEGYDLIHQAVEAIGLALGQQKYAAKYFGNGARINGFLRHPEQLKGEALKNLRESFNAKHQGLDNSHKIGILEEGMDWIPTSDNANDAQLMDAMQQSVIRVCRYFRVPPHKIQDLTRSTFSNIEHQSIEFVQDAILPHVKRFENEANRKLMMRGSRLFSEINVETLLRGDSKTQAEILNMAVLGGRMTPNEARRMQNMPPMEGGDMLYLQSNMMPLELLATGVNLPAMTQPDEGDAVEPDEDDGTTDDRSSQAREQIKTASMIGLSAALTRFVRLIVDRSRKAVSKDADIRSFTNDFFGDQTKDKAFDAVWESCLQAGRSIAVIEGREWCRELNNELQSMVVSAVDIMIDEAGEELRGDCSAVDRWETDLGPKLALSLCDDICTLVTEFDSDD